MKMRLINANEIKYREYRGGGGREYPENIVTEEEIAQMPTVDAVEVVRCKDCKKRSTCLCPLCHCVSPLINARDDDFRSYGERKDND